MHVPQGARIKILCMLPREHALNLYNSNAIQNVILINQCRECLEIPWKTHTFPPLVNKNIPYLQIKRSRYYTTTIFSSLNKILHLSSFFLHSISNQLFYHLQQMFTVTLITSHRISLPAMQQTDKPAILITNNLFVNYFLVNLAYHILQQMLWNSNKLRTTYKIIYLWPLIECKCYLHVEIFRLQIPEVI